MARNMSTIWFNVFNTLTLIFGLVCFVVAVYLGAIKGNDCQRALRAPLLISGLLSYMVGVTGLLGSCCRASFLMVIYIVVMFLLILGHLVYMCFMIVLTNRALAYMLIKLGFRKDVIDHLNFWWLKKHLLNGQSWNGIKSCLIESHICSSLDKVRDHNAVDFLKRKLPPVIAGCCKPPAFCGYRYKNATYWEVPAFGPAVPNADCMVWSNVQTELCYDCYSCKMGVLENTKKEWRSVALTNLIAIAIAIVTLMIACSTRRNITKENKGHA